MGRLGVGVGRFRHLMMGETEHRQALPSGYELKGYRLLEVLGVGGFGVTYLAHDRTLERRVAVKEYLPNEFAMREGATVYAKSASAGADFAWGLARFLDEARTLARFRHPNLVRVVEYFEANQTAYIVMEYEEGEALDRLLERHGRLTEGQLRRVLMPIVEGLGQVHEAGYLHRDIKPSNVFVRRSDESPVLLDFGAAREAMGRKSKSLTAIASAGYSPPEQYEGAGEQGPWTDIYALSALCYRAITGGVRRQRRRRRHESARCGGKRTLCPDWGRLGRRVTRRRFWRRWTPVCASLRRSGRRVWMRGWPFSRVLAGRGALGTRRRAGSQPPGSRRGPVRRKLRAPRAAEVWLAAAAAGLVVVAALAIWSPWEDEPLVEDAAGAGDGTAADAMLGEAGQATDR